jgi:serine/threonine protein kinase
MRKFRTRFKCHNRKPFTEVETVRGKKLNRTWDAGTREWRISARYLRQFDVFDHNFVSQFQREITLFSSLDHPNVVNFLGVDDDDTFVYVIMEYCPIGTLHELLVAQGAFQESIARSLTNQIVSATGYLHSLDIAHRDLKPENILIGENYTVKLADFGFSRKDSSETLFRTQRGSPLYASPEVISNIPYDGKAADMWSIGVILFALVCGSVPW